MVAPIIWFIIASTKKHVAISHLYVFCKQFKVMVSNGGLRNVAATVKMWFFNEQLFLEYSYVSIEIGSCDIVLGVGQHNFPRGQAFLCSQRSQSRLSRNIHLPSYRKSHQEGSFMYYYIIPCYSSLWGCFSFSSSKIAISFGQTPIGI